jgi:hypothetical protein
MTVNAISPVATSIGSLQAVVLKRTAVMTVARAVRAAAAMA